MLGAALIVLGVATVAATLGEVVIVVIAAGEVIVAAGINDMTLSVAIYKPPSLAAEEHSKVVTSFAVFTQANRNIFRRGEKALRQLSSL